MSDEIITNLPIQRYQIGQALYYGGRTGRIETYRARKDGSTELTVAFEDGGRATIEARRGEPLRLLRQDRATVTR